MKSCVFHINGRPTPVASTYSAPGAAAAPGSMMLGLVKSCIGTKCTSQIGDLIVLLQNSKVYYIPGWDCHGLPIELKVLQSLDQDTRKGLTPIKLRAKAAKFAKATVKAQMASFKRFGVWADWDHPYLTLDPEYEIAQIEVFGQMVFKGYIYRGRKPVHWSPSSRTALAEAELEYPEGHVSKSMYAIFRLLSTPTKGGLLDEFLPRLSLAVWTTTPWTIPANAAVAMNSKLQFAVVEVQSLSPDVASSKGGKTRIGSVLKGHERPFFIVALDLVPTLEAKWNVKLAVKKTVLGSGLENCRYAHPINGQECLVVIEGDYITTESRNWAGPHSPWSWPGRLYNWLKVWFAYTVSGRR